MPSFGGKYVFNSLMRIWKLEGCQNPNGIPFFLIVFWLVWKERNARVFRGSYLSSQFLRDRVVFLVSLLSSVFCLLLWSQQWGTGHQHNGEPNATRLNEP